MIDIPNGSKWARKKKYDDGNKRYIRVVASGKLTVLAVLYNENHERIKRISISTSLFLDVYRLIELDENSEYIL